MDDGEGGRDRPSKVEAGSPGARSEAATDKGQPPAVAEVHHLLSGGQPDPHAIAGVIRRDPAAKGEILALLHQTLGNAFVVGVMAAARPPATPGTMRVTASALNVRSTPDKSRADNIIGLLPHHAVVKTTGDGGDWIGIEHRGKPAFVYAQYLEPLPQPAQDPDTKAETTSPAAGNTPTPAAAHAAATPAPAPAPGSAGPAPTPASASSATAASATAASAGPASPATAASPASASPASSATAASAGPDSSSSATAASPASAGPASSAPATSSGSSVAAVEPASSSAPGASAPAPAAIPAPAPPSPASLMPAPAASSPLTTPAHDVAQATGHSLTVTPAPVGQASSVVPAALAGSVRGGALDELRDAVGKKSRTESAAAYQKLSGSERTQLRAELGLLVDLLAVLDATTALTVLDDLHLARGSALQVAAQARPADHAFLRDVLHHVHIDSIANVMAASGDLLANPAYLPMLDRVINAKGVTAKQQLALALSSNGIPLLEAVYPGLSPLAVLPALGRDPAALRDGYERSGTFGRWLFTDPAAIEELIKLGTDGAEWARSLWAGQHQGYLLGWIASDQAYWGNALGTALLKPAPDDAAALRSLKLVATAIFDSIARALSVEVLIDVFAALKLNLPEWINALGDTGRLDVRTLELALDGPNIGPAEQEVLARDDAAIARIRLIAPGKRASAVLTQLPSDPARFCAAVGRAGQFSKWVTGNVDQLAQEMQTVVDWDAWMTAFVALNDPLLFLEVAAKPAVQAPLRAAMTATGGWAWLLRSVPHPVPTQAQVDVLFKLYGDGSGIKIDDKYAMWDAIYRAPLKRKGNDDVASWTDTSKGEVGSKTFIGVDPSHEAMNLFFQQYGQMPRTHVDTADAVVFCNVWKMQKTFDVPGPDGKITKKTDWYDDQNKITTTPEQKMGTSFYWGYTNKVYMRATNPSGDVDTRLNTDDFVGLAGETAGAVNRSKQGLANPDMTFFQNHATHEVGHAVGNRTLKRGKYNVTGNDFCKQYGQWKDGGSGLDYARMLGFGPDLDSRTFDIRETASGTPRVQRFSGTEIREFLTGIVQGGLASQAGTNLATKIGSPKKALDAILQLSDVASTVLAMTVKENETSFPGAGWQFPHGINGEQKTVTMFADGRWQQYHATLYNHRVSSYSTYSVGENFAELYTARYTNGSVPPAIGGLSIADFFNELTQAEPADLGLAAPTPTTASPGAAAPKTDVSNAPPAAGGSDRVSS